MKLSEPLRVAIGASIIKQATALLSRVEANVRALVDTSGVTEDEARAIVNEVLSDIGDAYRKANAAVENARAEGRSAKDLLDEIEKEKPGSIDRAKSFEDIVNLFDL